MNKFRLVLQKKAPDTESYKEHWNAVQHFNVSIDRNVFNAYRLNDMQEQQLLIRALKDVLEAHNNG